MIDLNDTVPGHDVVPATTDADGDRTCDGCAFDHYTLPPPPNFVGCRASPLKPHIRCDREYRADRLNVIFVRCKPEGRPSRGPKKKRKAGPQ